MARNRSLPATCTLNAIMASVAGTQDSEPTQNFPFPIEIDTVILSYLVQPEHPSANLQGHPQYELENIVSYSLTCHRFRSLALPLLFRRFIVAEDLKDTRQHRMKEFCQAWIRGDKDAKECASYIQECTFTFGRMSDKRQRETRSFTSLVEDYMSAFAMLPNLSILFIDFSAVAASPEALKEILEKTPVEDLSIVGPFVESLDQNRDTLNSIQELSHIVCAHGTRLRTLETGSMCCPGLDLQILGSANFKLESLIYTSYHPIPDNARSLRSFIPTMPSLTSLDFIGDLGTPNSLDPTDLPHLHTLRCHPSYIPIFLPGSRPIHTLKIRYNPDQDDLSPPNIADFVDALRRSAGVILKLVEIPVKLATAAWGSYTSHLQSILITLPLIRSVQDIHEEITKLIPNIGGDDGSFQWNNLLDLKVQMMELEETSSRVYNDVETYAISLQLQRLTVAMLSERFPSLLSVRLERHTQWTRPKDAPKEWRVKLIAEAHSGFKRTLRRHKQWHHLDYDGVLAALVD